jgi:cellulose synthase operon protein C
MGGEPPQRLFRMTQSPSIFNEQGQLSPAMDSLLQADRLREEAEIIDDPSLKAALLHELGARAELEGDDATAAREYLASYNADPEFREPLESLVGLLSRRRSLKNLGRLLDALVRAASSPEAQARALIEQAAFMIDGEQNFDEAKGLLKEAIVQDPQALTAWLELEILAGKDRDEYSRLEALHERAAYAEPLEWRSLLLIDAAKLEAAQGDVEKAVQTLRSAAALDGCGRFAAFEALARLAVKEDNAEWLSESLEAQAEMLVEGLTDPDAGLAQGVPKLLSSRVNIVDCLIRAALVRRSLNDQDGFSTLMTRAISLLPNEIALKYQKLALLEAEKNHSEVAALAKELLQVGASGPEAASLWLRIFEEAFRNDQREQALEALDHALRADPRSIPARAWLIDLLSIDEQPEAGVRLASTLESSAEHFASDNAKVRMFLRSAWEWALHANDSQGARVALSQAGALGGIPSTLARVARSLSALVADHVWYEDATKRLIASGVTEQEHLTLILEQVRFRLQRGESDALRSAYKSLGLNEQGRWLALLLEIFVTPLLIRDENAPVDVEQQMVAIEGLIELEVDPEFRQALQMLTVRRAQLAGDEGQARERLRSLFEQDVSDACTSGYLSQMWRRAGDKSAVAKVLQETANASSDPDLAASLLLEAGLLLWADGKKEAAMEPWNAAKLHAPQSAASMLMWATRAVDPNTLHQRREVLLLAAEANEDESLLALERWGLEVASKGDPIEALTSLEHLEANSSGDFRMAAALARILWEQASVERLAVEEALTIIQKASHSGEALARGERVRIARDLDQNLEEYCKSAREWAAADASIETAVEWIAASAVTEQREQETLAYRTLASRMGKGTAGPLLTQATAIQWMASEGVQPNLVPSVDPSAQLFNLELSPAGCDPRRRSAALRGVDAETLGEESTLDALSLAGWSDLALGQPTLALEAFRKVVDARPADMAGWEGVRTSAMFLGDAVTTAWASTKLGELCQNPQRGGSFFEEAGMLWLEHVGDELKSIECFEQAFLRDPTLAVAFDKLFRHVRSAEMDDVLLELISRRLEVSEDPNEIVKMHWERARVLRKQGNQQAALEALTNVTMLEPDHVGALALKGEIYIRQGNFDLAAESLAILSTMRESPAKQRLISGITAVDLYEKRLKQPDKALEVLLQLQREGLSNVSVRERTAVVACKIGQWEHAIHMLEALMMERETPAGRVDAARLSMVIYRDKLHQPERAAQAVVKLLEERPFDGEALDLILTTSFENNLRNRCLMAGKRAIVQSLLNGELEVDQVFRLSRLCQSTEDGALTQAAMGVLVAMGRNTNEVGTELLRLDQRVAQVPQIRIDHAALSSISDPLDTGPIVQLFEVLGVTIGEALGPSKDTLGVGRRERVSPSSGLPLRNDVAAWAGALGLGEFELYVGGRDDYGVHAVAGDPPALVVGKGIQSPLNAAARQAIARELFALRRGLGVVRTRDEATVASVAIAACALVDVRLEGPAFAVMGDVQRQLNKAISRKTKKLLPDLCRHVAASRPDLRTWALAAQRSIDRMSAIAAGDVSLVLTDVMGVQRDDIHRFLKGNERAERLLRFVLSPQYLELRASLGMGVR